MYIEDFSWPEYQMSQMGQSGVLLVNHRNEKVVRVTALIFIGDVEDKLQRLQWIPRLSTWRPFRFCNMVLSWSLLQQHDRQHDTVLFPHVQEI